MAQETQKGRRWDETKIKALTGGDKITARFMRQDFFDFELDRLGCSSAATTSRG